MTTTIYKLNRKASDTTIIAGGLGEKNNDIQLNGETIPPVDNVVNINALTTL